MPDTVTIFGRILNASAVPQVDVVVQLKPAPASVDSPEIVGGEGILLDHVEELTDSDGEFIVTAIQGARYTLDIPALGYRETFRAPPVGTISFHLLGLVPVVEQTTDSTDEDGALHIGATVRTPRIETVLERFNVLVLERSDNGRDGPWIEVDTADLEHGVDSYAFIDDGGSLDAWYRAYYRNTKNTDIGEAGDAVTAGAIDEALVMTIDELKDIYLFGVDLTDDAGNPFPDRMFDLGLRRAVKWLEKELDIPITPIEIVDELHDHYAQDYGRWGYFQLKSYPVLKLRKVSFRYPSMTTGVDIDPEWYVLEDEGQHGVIQIVPGQGNIADVLLIPGALMPLWSGATGRVPGVWRISYRAGFEVGAVPADIKDLIGMAASFGPFNVAGDLVAGAGIATMSVGVPGLSQSIGTTASATNAGYGSRLIQYERQIKSALPALKRYYGKGSKLYVA